MQGLQQVGEQKPCRLVSPVGDRPWLSACQAHAALLHAQGHCRDWSKSIVQNGASLADPQHIWVLMSGASAGHGLSQRRQYQRKHGTFGCSVLCRAGVIAEGASVPRQLQGVRRRVAAYFAWIADKGRGRCVVHSGERRAEGLLATRARVACNMGERGCVAVALRADRRDVLQSRSIAVRISERGRRPRAGLESSRLGGDTGRKVRKDGKRQCGDEGEAHGFSALRSACTTWFLHLIPAGSRLVSRGQRKGTGRRELQASLPLNTLKVGVPPVCVCVVCVCVRVTIRGTSHSGRTTTDYTQ
jgi:hypothetical protein